MLRSAVLFKKANSVITRAISAATGNRFPPEAAAALDSLPFTSPLWLTAGQASRFGVTIKAEEVGKGFVSKMPTGAEVTFYNAEQTSDASRVVSLKGHGRPVHALSQEPLPEDARKAIALAPTKFDSNEWISEMDIEGLGLTLTEGSQPVAVTFYFKEEEKKIVKQYYNIAQIKEIAMVQGFQQVYPISVSSGRRFDLRIAHALLRAGHENKFTSPFWLTLSGVQRLGLVVADPTAGTDISLAQDTIVTFFNAEQTDNPIKVATAAYSAKSQPRSSMSGRPFPEVVSSVLRNASHTNKFSSVYWITPKQAELFGIQIKDGAVPTTVSRTDGPDWRIYNLDQTNGGGKTIEAHLKQSNKAAMKS